VSSLYRTSPFTCYKLTNRTSVAKDQKARIWHKSAIEHDGNVIGGADPSSVLPGDFIIPSEETTQQNAMSVMMESLDFFASDNSTSTTPMNETPDESVLSEAQTIRTYSAMIRFSVDVDGEKKRQVNLELKYNVQFVTAFPCVTSPYTDMVRSPTSPSFQSSQQSPSSSPRDLTGLTHLAGLLITS